MAKFVWWRSVLACSLMLGGCAEDRGFVDESGSPGAGEDGGDGDTTPSGGQDGDDGTTGQGGDEGGSSTGGDDGIRLDVGHGEGGPGDDVDDGCDKVGFLFIVDNSGSMEDEQQSLIDSFPKFLDTIRETLEDAQDFHILVTSTDDGQGSSSGSSCMTGPSGGFDCTCDPAPLCCVSVCGDPNTSACNGTSCDDLDYGNCDGTLGAGRRLSGDGEDCMLADDRRYMLQDQPDIDAAFSCVARVGTYGNGNEKPMEAMMKAVSEEYNTADGCNDGFLRDDAILVVTFITDEEDVHKNMLETGSTGDPPDWVRSIAEAKNGNADAAVILGLIGDTDQPNGTCSPLSDAGTGAEPAPRLREFIESFTHGIAGSVCAADYNPFFEQAVSVIDTTCDDFIPPE